MRPIRPLIPLLVATGFALPTWAIEPGLYYSHKDWELACDNTRTCRAAGYHAEDGDTTFGVSLLLVRSAGPNESVDVQLKLASYGIDEPSNAMPRPSKVRMLVNGRPLGTVELTDASGSLSAPQAQALLAALRGKASIVWKAGAHEWTLSDQGATAVLLKMDEFQGRIGTPGALVKPGRKDEQSVPKAVPIPILQAQAVSDQPVALSPAQKTRLLSALKPEVEGCPSSEDAAASLNELSVWRLNARKLLVSIPCWRAAYNEGIGFWIVDSQEPYRSSLVTQDGGSYQGGTIGASHKGRGLGDCWSQQSWTWDGRSFVLTSQGTTGLCKLIEPGGAWDLPTLVTEVLPPRP